MKTYLFKILTIAFIISLAANISVARAAAPDLEVTIMDKVGYINVGNDLTYVIYVDNVGDGDAQSVDLKATFSENLSYVSDTTGVDHSANLTSYSWTLGKIAAGESKSFEVVFSTNSLLQTFTNDSLGVLKAGASASTISREPLKLNNTSVTETLLLPALPDQTQFI